MTAEPPVSDVGESVPNAVSLQVRTGQESDNRSALLELHDIAVSFDVGGGRFQAIKDISLDVYEGEFVTLVGPSGSGKTTLLRAVHGLIPATAGEVLLRGERVRGPGKGRGFVFQSDCLLPWRTILDNVCFSLEVQGTSRAAARGKARELLELTGLAPYERRFPAELSGGMRQRVNLARALAIDPYVLLMDEPFAALDAQTREVMQMELLSIWQQRQKTVLFVTHQLDEAVYLADRVVVLGSNPGTVREVITVDLPRPRSLDVKHTPEFARQVDRVWDLIKDQVMQHRHVPEPDS